ncbi:pyrimidine dimer DNA glycosylase/endonuclease V [Micrococcoides hystricis]|uniref:Pyrimidine dimer DNA glycosylase/endonuclease V n=1 Tax=Micrococcoides hystricis TaxID=1572761 RepID=A0ABV6P8H5_9MICC
MRLWSLHPSLLDRQGLTAVWREALLAQKVLQGLTRGYRNHPQLERFKACTDPVQAIGTFLHGIADEADARNYHFDRSRVNSRPDGTIIAVTDGQLMHEWSHLLGKLAQRSPSRFAELQGSSPTAHAMMQVMPGPIASWERP